MNRLVERRTYEKYPLLALALLLAFLYSVFNPLRANAAAVVIDSNVNATITTHNGTTNTVVFTDDQTGYVFYADSTGACVYSKTTNAGTSWSAGVTVDSQTDCIRIAVWYDRWTPGNTTGTMIHVITMDASADDLWYTRLNTASDTLSTTLDVTLSQGGTFTAGSNIHALTVGTDGTIYTGVQDGGDSFVMKCKTNCTTATSSWTEAGTGTSVFDLANDWLLLMPLSGVNANKILAVRWDTSLDDVGSKIWDNASSTWTSSWVNTDINCLNNGTYDGHFGSTLNALTGDIYLAMVCDASTIGTDDDIRTRIFQNASSSWTTTTDAITNNSQGLTGTKISLDSNTGNIYVVYSRRTTNGSAPAHVYYKISTSSMSTWGAEQGPVSNTSTDIYGLRIDAFNQERIYATWVGTTTLSGATIADLVQTTYEQTSYKFFNNRNATTVGSEFDSQNTPAVMPPAGTPFRLRMLVHVGGGGTDAGRENYKLQIATSTKGGCDTSFSGETYVDVATSTGEVRFYDNSSSTDGSALSATSTDPTHNSDTIVNQTYEEANPFTNSVNKILGGQDGKWDFSLVDNSAPSLQTYCFRIVKETDALFNTYTNIPEIQKNAVPTVGNISLNRNQNITLTEGTTTAIIATTTVSDTNGYQDLYNVSAKVFRSGVGANCTPDANNCYSIPICTFTSCASNSCDVTCDINLQYHADPTDSGTPWDSEDWKANLTVYDDRNTTSSATSSVSIDLLTLLGLSVTPSISYGNLSPGSTTSPITQTTTVSSTGNASMDLTLYGTNMTLASDTIAVGEQRYATTSRTYNSSTILLLSPGATLDVNMKKTTTTTQPTTSTFNWGIHIPLLTVSGLYTGNNTFVGVANSLPWP